MARIVDELEQAADDTAADQQRRQQYRDTIARLCGQADMARIAADHHEHCRPC